LKQTFHLEYTDLIVPANNSFDRRIISRPMIDTVLSHHAKDLDFSFACIVDSGADLLCFSRRSEKILGFNMKKSTMQAKEKSKSFA